MGDCCQLWFVVDSVLYCQRKSSQIPSSVSFHASAQETLAESHHGHKLRNWIPCSRFSACRLQKLINCLFGFCLYFCRRCYFNNQLKSEDFEVPEDPAYEDISRSLYQKLCVAHRIGKFPKISIELITIPNVLLLKFVRCCGIEQWLVIFASGAGLEWDFVYFTNSVLRRETSCLKVLSYVFLCACRACCYRHVLGVVSLAFLILVGRPLHQCCFALVLLSLEIFVLLWEH